MHFHVPLSEIPYKQVKYFYIMFWIDLLEYICLHILS